jgi:DNA-binding CsgD family transcriptional regulator
MVAVRQRAYFDATVAARTARQVRTATGADVGFAAVLDRSGTTFRVGQLTGHRTARMDGIVSTLGVGVGGRCIQLGRPVLVSDYIADRGITHQFDAAVSSEGLHAMFAVPLRVNGEIRGAVYGALRHPVRFGDQVVRLAESTCNLEACQAAAPDHRDRVQQAYAELRAIIPGVADASVRAELDAVAQTLAGTDTPTWPVQLSRREIDVLAMVAIGCANEEVARRLSLSVLTVKSYLKSAMCKLGGRNRTEAVRLARRHGLLP